MNSKSGSLMLVCGLPGSGKTTFAKKLEKQTGAVRFCPDEWMEEFGITLWDEKFRQTIENLFWSTAKQILSQGGQVVLEYGFWTRSKREKFLDEAKLLDSTVNLYYMDTDLDEIKKRLAMRGMEGDDLILKEKLSEYVDNFEEPSEVEIKKYDYYEAVK